MNGQFIRSAFDDPLVIDVMSGKATPGAPLQVWRIKEDPHSARIDDAMGLKEPDNQLWNNHGGPVGRGRSLSRSDWPTTSSLL